MNIKVLVAYHKDSVKIENDVFQPIQVGRSKAKIKLDMIGDDTGDNISYKNPYYCEMSAIYWGWKNVDADYIGLCHYRRVLSCAHNTLYWYITRYSKYFLTKLYNLISPGKNMLLTSLVVFKNKQSYISAADNFSTNITSILADKKIDIVVPTPIRMASINVRTFFEISIDQKIILDNIVKDLYPEYFKYYIKTLYGNKLYAANIFLMKKDFYNEYCNIVFSILAEHERRTKEIGWCHDLEKEKCYSRLLGYFGEYLTSAFILMKIHQGACVKYVNLAYLDL